MKKSIFSLILLLLFVFTPGMTCRNPAAIKTKEQTKVEQVQKEIDKKDKQLEDKGKALVYGAKYTLEQETNKTPTIVVSSRFLDLATLSIGNPSVSDAKIMQEISEGLLAESKIQLTLTKEEADKYKKLHLDGEIKFKKLENEIILIQKEKQSKINELEIKNNKLIEVNAENAGKAAEWDESQAWYNQLNPFKDIFSFFKKLFIWGIILGVGYIIFHILEIFFPGLSIISTIGGWIMKCIAKLTPKAKKIGGFVSSNVFDGFKNVVTAIDSTLNKLKNYPIEQEIIAAYPDDKLFTKKEVLQLLEANSEQIENLLRTELKEATNEIDRSIITMAKVSAGIKKEDIKIDI